MGCGFHCIIKIGDAAGYGVETHLSVLLTIPCWRTWLKFVGTMESGVQQPNAISIPLKQTPENPTPGAPYCTVEVCSHDIPSQSKPRHPLRVGNMQEWPLHFRLYCQTHLFQKCCFTFFRVFKENACWLSILIDDSTIGVCHFSVQFVSFQICLMRWVSFCFNLMIIKCTSYIIKIRIDNYIKKWPFTDLQTVTGTSLIGWQCLFQFAGYKWM